MEAPGFHPRRPHLVTPVRRDRTGRDGPTDSALRDGWRRTSRGLYVPTSPDPLVVEQRIVEAAALLPTYGAVTGWAALRWLGGYWFGGLESDGITLRDVPLATPHIRSQPGIRVCEEGLGPAEIIEVDGLRITTAVRSVCFEMRYAGSDGVAVSVLDMAAYNDLVTIEDLAAYAATKNAWTGIPRCRKAIPFADENAWSPTEVTMRLAWEVTAGRPRPLTNRPVFDLDGAHIATPDLLDPDAGVFAEYNGADFHGEDRREHDERRLARLAEVGLHGVEMTADDLGATTAFVARLNAAYDAAHEDRDQPRRWTVDPPTAWIPTWSVSLRRALPESQRGHTLRYRLTA